MKNVRSNVALIWFVFTDQDDNLIEPENKSKTAVLIISMSDKVNRERIHAVLGNDISIWEITVDEPNRNIMQTKETLINFKNKVRDAYSDIRTIQGENSEIHLFPVMPNSFQTSGALIFWMFHG